MTRYLAAGLCGIGISWLGVGAAEPSQFEW
jgi:hypothetical protein